MWWPRLFLDRKKMIESLENKKVKNWTKLHLKKYRDDEYLLLTKELVLEAYKTGYLKTLIYTGERPFEFDESYKVSREVLDKISKLDNLNYIGVGKKINESCDYQNRVLILEDLKDPLNIGRIFESAYEFGYDSVILSEDAADFYHPKSLEASRGALYHLNIKRGNVSEEIAKLKSLGFKVYATGLRDNTLSLDEVKESEKMAFILGNEGSGVKESTFQISDEVIKIDMHNIDSLNVAMAGAIVLYNFSNI